MTSSASSETPPPAEGLIVGEVVGPFGVAGEIKLYPLTDFPERLRRYRRLVLQLPDGSRREVRVRRARAHKNIWLLKLQEVSTPEEAEALRGAQAIVPAHLVEALPEGHFYLHDVIGLRAVTAAGEELGTVSDVLRSPANDIYVVDNRLIPAVKGIVERIDPGAGLLVVSSKEALASVDAAPAGTGEGAESTRTHRATEGSRRRVTVRGKQSKATSGSEESGGTSSVPS
jgi:16S rRNA processing protein RimM